MQSAMFEGGGRGRLLGKISFSTIVIKQKLSNEVLKIKRNAV